MIESKIVKKKLLVICNIAKKELEKQEGLLLQNTQLIAREHQNINLVNIEISKLAPPASGSFKDFANYKAVIASFLYQIEEFQNNILLLKKEQEQIKINLKVAHINYEKMLYVYNKQKDIDDKKYSDNEKKMIDEVSIMLQKHKERL